jgi:hypothetical protein
VDDAFFSLEEMNAYLEREDEREMRGDNSSGGAGARRKVAQNGDDEDDDDEEEEGDEDLDFFAAEDDEEEEKEEEEGAQADTTDMYGKDFFRPPNSRMDDEGSEAEQAPGGSDDDEEDDEDGVVDLQREALGSEEEDEEEESGEDGEEEEDEEEENEDGKKARSLLDSDDEAETNNGTLGQGRNLCKVRASFDSHCLRHVYFVFLLQQTCPGLSGNNGSFKSRSPHWKSTTFLSAPGSFLAVRSSADLGTPVASRKRRHPISSHRPAHAPTFSLETHSKKRPENSLLQEDLDFDQTAVTGEGGQAEAPWKGSPSLSLALKLVPKPFPKLPRLRWKRPRPWKTSSSGGSGMAFLMTLSPRRRGPTRCVFLGGACKPFLSLLFVELWRKPCWPAARLLTHFHLDGSFGHSHLRHAGSRSSRRSRTKRASARSSRMCVIKTLLLIKYRDGCRV